jgi:hypothetical protein
VHAHRPHDAHLNRASDWLGNSIFVAGCLGRNS